MPISVVINTYNEEKHISKALDSVKEFDEIVVCDMESTDNTVHIAEQYGCKVVTFEKGDYNIVEPARQFAIDQATHPWVLVVDADEIVTKELREYLYELIKQDNCPNGVYIPRKNYFMGRFMHCYYPDHILRFIKKEHAYWPPIIHVSPEIEGSIYKIPAKNIELAFEHLAENSIEDIITKTNIYTRNEIEKRKDKNYTPLALVYRPFVRFFKNYVIKQGFRDGAPGFIKACFDGFYQFTVVAKILEERQKELKR